jgi:elongation factor P
VQTKLKSIRGGQIVSRKFGSTEKVEFAFLDKRPCEYLYKDGNAFVFMDNQTFEQYHLDAEQVGDLMRYIVENSTVQVTFYETTAVSLDLPGSVELKVEFTEPGIRGDSVNNVYKPAKLETGFEIKVPNHVEIGDTVKVNTQTGEFQGRA